MARKSLPLFGPTPAGESEHEWYVACRDHRAKQGVRRALSRIWSQHGHLISEPPDEFLRQFRAEFPARSWELYILGWLARAGATLARSPRKGPDFRASHPDLGRFWVECVVPTPGTTNDAVRARSRKPVGSLGPDDTRRVALRYTSVLRDKIAKIDGYRRSAIVAPKEPVLVAMNQGAIDLSDLHDLELPLIVRVLYGIGDTVIRIDPHRGTSRLEVPPMPSIQKSTGNARGLGVPLTVEVSTMIFGEPSSASIAGVLFAQHSIFNLFPGRRRLLYLAHNAQSPARMAVGMLPVRGEIWVGLRHRGVVSNYGPFSRRAR